MPFPFDKYKRPGSAKYWLAKYPPTDASQDEYDAEKIYLDELDQRVRDAAANYQPSQKWKDAYNEGNWENHDFVTETYGNIGGDVSQEVLKKYGRGRKIDPSHYINPKYFRVDRNADIPSQYMHPDLQKRLGPLRHKLAIPPEEDSVFKLWNPTNMFGCLMAVLLSKEWFLVSHDMWHAMTFWMTWSFIISVSVDWWSWWQALRGQEFYDHHFFPLRERTEKLFEIINRLENQPKLAKQISLMMPYWQGIQDRCNAKARNETIYNVTTDVLEKLEAQAKKEGSQRTAVQNSFKETAFQTTLSNFGKPEYTKKYFDLALAKFQENAEFKTGVPVRDSGLEEFKAEYDKVFGGLEKAYMADQKKAGTLPWVFAADAEVDAARMSAKDVEERYRNIVNPFEKKFHKVSVCTL